MSHVGPSRPPWRHAWITIGLVLYACKIGRIVDAKRSVWVSRMRCVVVGDAPNAFDGAQESVQARPRDRRRGGVPVLSERGVDGQGVLGLRRTEWDRKGGWVVVRDKLRWYVLERGMGAYRGEVLQRAEGGDQPEFCVRSRDEAIWDIAQVFRECCLARTCFPYVRLRCHYNIFTCTFKSSFPQ